jgi:hypothetical protein
MPNMKDIPTKTYHTGKSVGQSPYNAEKGATEAQRINRRLENHETPDSQHTTHPTRTIHNVYFPSGHAHSPVRPPMPQSDRAIHGPEKKGEPSPPMNAKPKDNWHR